MTAETVTNISQDSSPRQKGTQAGEKFAAFFKDGVY